jgi:hypothetical protein
MQVKVLATGYRGSDPKIEPTLQLEPDRDPLHRPREFITHARDGHDLFAAVVPKRLAQLGERVVENVLHGHATFPDRVEQFLAAHDLVGARQKNR